MDAAVPRRALLIGLGSAAALHAIGCSAGARPAPIAKPPPPPTTAVPVETAAIASASAEPAVAPPPEPPPPPTELPLALPARGDKALTGSQFLRKSKGLGREGFDKAVLAQIEEGNVPDFERKLLPITTTNAAGHTAILFVLADYLAIGSDADFIRTPMTPAAAQTITELTKTMLPTTHLVDAIYKQAAAKLPPSYIDGGPTDDEIADFFEHHKKLETARRKKGFALGVLTAGDMKDIVICNRLEDHPEKVAIYGWHTSDDSVIQHLSTVHSTRYADYSHGVRLVDRRVYVDGKERDLEALLHDEDLADLVSDEGPVRVIAYAKTLPTYAAATQRKSK